MRILHTADWHLGYTRDKMDRRDEQQQVVREICDIARAESVDLVLLAGDIYDTFTPPASAERLFFDALDELAEGGRRGIVVIAGNHDSPERLSAVHALAERLGVSIIGMPSDVLPVTADHDAARVRRLAARRFSLEVAVPGCAERAVVGVLPFPSESRLQEVLSKTVGEEDLRAAYNERVRQLFAEAATHFRADTVNLVMSHLFVAGGAESDSERSVQLGGSYAVTPDVFPAAAHYVALGHLHRPQIVAGAPALTRYSGAPLAYSFSEVGQAKSVMLLDVVPGRPVVEREIFLTRGRPLTRWTADSIRQVEARVAEGRDPTAWIDLEIRAAPGAAPALLSMDEIQKLRKLCPRFVNVRTPLPALADVASQPAPDKLPIDEMFRRFYKKSHGADPDDTLVRLFMELTT